MHKLGLLLVIVLTLGLSTTTFADGTEQNNSLLYTADLETGTLTEIGRIGDGVSVSGIAVSGQGQTIYAVTTTNHVLSFDASTPGTITSQYAITGLQDGERVLGIDIRPANGTLYALGSSSRVYTVDPASGAASAVGSPFTPALEGTSFGFDFNPTVDRIRVVSNTGQNLRLNPDTGAVGKNPDTGAPTIDKQLAYADGDTNGERTPGVVGAGYTNSVAGASSTELFVIDAQQAVLALQNPPNDGVLNTVGALGVMPTATVGFDIAPSGTAYVSIASTSAMMPGTGVATDGTGMLLGVALSLVVAAVGLRMWTTARTSRA